MPENLEIFVSECLDDRVTKDRATSAFKTLYALGIPQASNAGSLGKSKSGLSVAALGADAVKALLRRARSGKAASSFLATETVRILMSKCNDDTFADSAGAFLEAICSGLSSVSKSKNRDDFAARADPSFVLSSLRNAASFTERAASDRRTKQTLKSGGIKGSGSGNLFSLLLDCADVVLRGKHAYLFASIAADALRSIQTCMKNYPGGFRGSSVRMGRMFVQSLHSASRATRSAAAACVASLPVTLGGSGDSSNSFASSWESMMGVLLEILSALLAQAHGQDPKVTGRVKHFPPLEGMVSWLKNAPSDWCSRSYALDGALRCIEASLRLNVPKSVVAIPVDSLLGVARYAVYSNIDDGYSPKPIGADKSGFASGQDSSLERENAILICVARTGSYRIASALVGALGTRMLRHASLLVDMILHSLKMHSKWPCSGIDLETCFGDFAQVCFARLGPGFSCLLANRAALWDNLLRPLQAISASAQANGGETAAASRGHGKQKGSKRRKVRIDKESNRVQKSGRLSEGDVQSCIFAIRTAGALLRVSGSRVNADIRSKIDVTVINMLRPLAHGRRAAVSSALVASTQLRLALYKLLLTSLETPADGQRNSHTALCAMDIFTRGLKDPCAEIHRAASKGMTTCASLLRPRGVPLGKVYVDLSAPQSNDEGDMSDDDFGDGKVDGAGGAETATEMETYIAAPASQPKQIASFIAAQPPALPVAKTKTKPEPEPKHAPQKPKEKTEIKIADVAPLPPTLVNAPAASSNTSGFGKVSDDEDDGDEFPDIVM